VTLAHKCASTGRRGDGRVDGREAEGVYLRVYEHRTDESVEGVEGAAGARTWEGCAPAQPQMAAAANELHEWLNDRGAAERGLKRCTSSTATYTIYLYPWGQAL